MEHPVKTAPCPLYFAAHGGTFDALGNPILSQEDRGRMLSTVVPKNLVDEVAGLEQAEALLAPLLCDVAYDCGVCPLLHQWVAGEQGKGWYVDWECWVCIKYNKTKDGPGIEKRFPGFYQSGRPGEGEGDPRDRDDDNPPLTGCTSCGRPRSILQLVLRRQRP